MTWAEYLTWLLVVFCGSVAVGLVWEAKTKGKGAGAVPWAVSLLVGFMVVTLWKVYA